MSQKLTHSTASPSTPAPTPEAKVREAVVKLFAAYPAHGSAEMTESAIGTYVAILSEYPMTAIIESAKAFLSGRVSGHNPAFRPSVAQWAVEARKHRDEARAAAMPPKALPPPEKPVSPEERAKVAALMAGLIEKLGGTQSPCPTPERTIDEIVVDTSGLAFSPALRDALSKGKGLLKIDQTGAVHGVRHEEWRE